MTYPALSRLAERELFAGEAARATWLPLPSYWFAHRLMSHQAAWSWGTNLWWVRCSNEGR
jgi:hypothetical protein